MAQNKRKISVTTIKLSDQPTGYTFGGIYKGIVLGANFQQVDSKTGEVVTKQMRHVVFENNGNRTAFVADTGLVQTLETAMVKEGDSLEIVKLEKVKLSKGRTMNQYDIFAV